MISKSEQEVNKTPLMSDLGQFVMEEILCE